MEAICTRAVIIDRGRIVVDATPAELAAKAPPGRLDEVFRHHHRRHQRSGGMNVLSAVFKREFTAYFATPLAYVFIVIFLFAMGAFTFYVGHFYDNGIADLTVFFGFHPWLYLFLVPAFRCGCGRRNAAAARWSLLLTLPVPLWATVVGKYLAAWAFIGIALALTFPIWLTVNFLGHPDNGVILASLYRQLPDGGRLSRHRRLHLGDDQQPGDRLRRQRGGLLPVHGLRRAAGARFLPRLGAAAAGRRRSPRSASSPISPRSPRA